MFYRLPHPWNPGYAIPDYIMAEPPGRGVHRTKYMPRRTIDTTVPVYLGDDTVPVGARSDMIANFGKRGSEWIMATIGTVPRDERKAALRILLNHLESGLYDKVAGKAEKFQSQGYAPTAALHKALAAAMSEGLLNQLIDIGRGHKHSLGLWNPFGWAAKKIAGAGGRGAEWAKEGVEKLGSLACGVVSSDLGVAAAAGGAGAAGVPPQVGAQGAQIANQVCKSGDKKPLSPTKPIPVQGGSPSWVMPAAIGAGALVLFLALRK